MSTGSDGFLFRFCTYLLYEQKHNQNYSSKHHLESVPSQDHSLQGQINLSDVFQKELHNGLIAESLQEEAIYFIINFVAS